MDRLSAALRNDLCLLAEDTLLDDHWQFYTVTVPSSFMAGKGPRGITASLAFDPPARLSRRDYLSRTMEIEVLKGVSREQLIAARDKGGVDRLKQSHQLTLYPPKTVVARSTLQVRRMDWGKRPSFPLVDNETEPKIHILVKCQARFRAVWAKISVTP